MAFEALAGEVTLCLCDDCIEALALLPHARPRPARTESPVIRLLVRRSWECYSTQQRSTFGFRPLIFEHAHILLCGTTLLSGLAGGDRLSSAEDSHRDLGDAGMARMMLG